MRRASAVFALALFTASAFAAQSDDEKLAAPRNVLVKAPASKVAVTLSLPAIFKLDTASAAKIGAVAIYDRDGADIDSGNALLTVDFDPKGLADGSTKDIQSYFGYVVSNLTSHIPGLQFTRWQPGLLNANDVNYMSIETQPVAKMHYIAERLVVLEVADGFYTISFHARNKEIFDNPLIEEIFDDLEKLNPGVFVPPAAMKKLQLLHDAFVSGGKSKLHLAFPEGFLKDEKRTATKGYNAVYAFGGDASDSPMVVTIEFHAKNGDHPSTADLPHFFTWWLIQAHSQFPKASTAEWSPKATKLPATAFRSIEMAGEGDSVCSHVLVVAANDGYFVVIGYGGALDLLNGSDMTAVMNSVLLEP